MHEDEYEDGFADERALADRPIAPGGWRRALLGLLVGALAGAAIAFALPRDDLPRRRRDPRER